MWSSSCFSYTNALQRRHFFGWSGKYQCHSANHPIGFGIIAARRIVRSRNRAAPCPSLSTAETSSADRRVRRAGARQVRSRSERSIVPALQTLPSLRCVARAWIRADRRGRSPVQWHRNAAERVRDCRSFACPDKFEIDHLPVSGTAIWEGCALEFGDCGREHVAPIVRPTPHVDMPVVLFVRSRNRLHPATVLATFGDRSETISAHSLNLQRIAFAPRGAVVFFVGHLGLF